MPKICPICDRSYSDDNAFCPSDGTTLRADVTGDLLGSVIADRYLITDLLGEGGMGRVYLGQHVRLPQQAAIKVLRQDLVQDTASIARFNREATSASRIQNEYVARVFDFGETSDRMVYLAMEYVPGRTLRNLVQAEGPIPLPRTAKIISQIAEGLDAAHKLGIVHRDLKPDNVIIMHDDDVGDRAKVVDFGIAKAMGGNSEKGGQITSTGFVVGTPDYMSPEQLLNDTIDARSDVYALGLVAYNMLTATLPFDSSTPSKGMMARLIDQPAPLSQSNPRGMWSLQVQQVFDTVLSRDVDKRYATAREFAHALRECAGISAPTYGVAMTATAMNAGGAAVSATGLRTSAAGGESRTSTGAAAVVTPSGYKSRLLMISGGLVSVAAIALAVVIFNGGPPDNGVGGPATVDPIAAAETPRSGDAAATRPVASGDSALTSSTTLAEASRTPPPTTRGETPPTNPGRASNPPVTSAPVPAARTPAGAPITASIDSVMKAFDDLLVSVDDIAVANGARTLIQRVSLLLRRAPSSADSARLIFLSGNASKLTGDEKAACATLRLAAKLEMSAADKRAFDRYHGQWGCDSSWR